MAATALTVRKRRPTTSSERGRKYRECMSLMVHLLEENVTELRALITKPYTQRSIQDVRILQRRYDAHGSLAKLVHRYFTVLEESMTALPRPGETTFLVHNETTARQLEQQGQGHELFLASMMDPLVIAGDLIGPLAVLDQWRRYARSHSGFRARILNISTSGPPGDPVVTLQARASEKITGATFYALFPGVIRAENDDLVQKFLNRTVSYDITNRYCFTQDSRIRTEIVEINFVRGLQDMGASVSEIAQLMENSTISMHCTIRESVSGRFRN